MKKRDRYDTSGLPEARQEPGSRGRVLWNLRGINGKREMDRLEAAEHLRALRDLLTQYDREHRFTADDICHMHKTWLGVIYPWAGNYRQVNISKGNFPFAASSAIPAQMSTLERGALRECTPCLFQEQSDVVHALARTHTELVLIHPFREGNGRVARMLSILMALQAGLPPLDFSAIKGRKRQDYFAAVRAGLDYNYRPMEAIFRAVISRTLRQDGRS